MNTENMLNKLKTLEEDLRNAIAEGNESYVKSILKIKPALLNAPDPDGDTPLILACMFQQFKIAKILIEQGADINQADKEGFTALHWTAEHGEEEITKLLIEKKAALDQQESAGNTSLHFAAYNKNKNIIDCLIASGANAKIKNSLGQTYYDVLNNPVQVEKTTFQISPPNSSETDSSLLSKLSFSNSNSPLPKSPSANRKLIQKSIASPKLYMTFIEYLKSIGDEPASPYYIGQQPSNPPSTKQSLPSLEVDHLPPVKSRDASEKGENKNLGVKELKQNIQEKENPELEEVENFSMQHN